MVNDFWSFIHDSEARGPITCLIECVLVLPINPCVAQRDTRDFPQFPAHSAPVDAAHDHGKVVGARIFMKELGKYFLGTLQSIRFAALPMRGRVGVKKPLDATPSKGTYFDGFASQIVTDSAN